MVGRGALLCLINPVLSRRHASILIEDNVTVVVTAHSPVTLLRRPSGDTTATQQPQLEQQLVAPGASAALHIGDRIFLLKTPQGLRYGYQLACLVDGRLCTAPPPAAAAPQPAAPAVVSPVAATEPAVVAASPVDEEQFAAEAAAAEVEAAEARGSGNPGCRGPDSCRRCQGDSAGGCAGAEAEGGGGGCSGGSSRGGSSSSRDGRSRSGCRGSSTGAASWR